jgi:hypothetical protein
MSESESDLSSGSSPVLESESESVSEPESESVSESESESTSTDADADADADAAGLARTGDALTYATLIGTSVLFEGDSRDTMTGSADDRSVSSVDIDCLGKRILLDMDAAIAAFSETSASTSDEAPVVEHLNDASPARERTMSSRIRCQQVEEQRKDRSLPIVARSVSMFDRTDDDFRRIDLSQLLFPFFSGRIETTAYSIAM